MSFGSTFGFLLASILDRLYDIRAGLAEVKSSNGKNQLRNSNRATSAQVRIKTVWCMVTSFTFETCVLS